MKLSQIIIFMGLITLFLAGSTPTTYGLEDGQFPVFPTVIGEGNNTISPSPLPVTETVKSRPSPMQPIKEKEKVEKDNGVKRDKSIVTNETGVFSPWGTVKQAFIRSVRAGEEGVVFSLETVDAKPSGQGDLRYRISYINNTDETLRNVSVQVFLPKNLQFLDSNLKPDSKRDEVVVFDIGKVAAGEESTINFETRLKKKNAKEVTLRATMTYEDIDGGKHAVTAAANNVFNGKNPGFTASALDSIGGFTFWLFVIALIVALAFVAYQYLTLRASTRRA